MAVNRMLLMVVGENEKELKSFLGNISDEMNQAKIFDAHVIIENPHKFVSMMNSGCKIELDTWPSEKH